MAVRARLTAPRTVREDWPWHDVKSASLRASLLFSGDRRMEAENFLGSGFGTRRAIEATPHGWVPLGSVVRAWQPSRLKGIQVSPEYGMPFLAATQVFDTRPVARKWLSLERTDDHAQRVIAPGTILVTCSGDVGRATLAHVTTSNVLVSHDLLRIEPNEDWRGWVYAYLRAPTVRAMMKSAQYGHIIKHLETQHLDALPLVLPPSEEVKRRCSEMAATILRARNAACERIAEAERSFEGQFASGELDRGQEAAFVRRARDTLFSNRRRFDAWTHNPERTGIEKSLRAGARSWVSLAELGCKIWLPNRFKRIPAEDGAELVDSSSIFEINPDPGRRVVASGVADRYNGMVRRDWLMMSRSGQVYGLLGSVVIANEGHEGKLISDDVIRIASGDGVDPGYLYVVLAHATLGRPRVKALAYGSSIPHIEVEDLKQFGIPRLDASVEKSIGEAAREAFALWAKADQAENELAELAEAAVAGLLAHSA